MYLFNILGRLFLASCSARVIRTPVHHKFRLIQNPTGDGSCYGLWNRRSTPFGSDCRLRYPDVMSRIPYQAVKNTIMLRETATEE